ncbi:hypothetical protein M752DRAFT_218915, partial [Aspergillus phoenicis ATCC 13157]
TSSDMITLYESKNRVDGIVGGNNPTGRQSSRLHARPTLLVVPYRRYPIQSSRTFVWILGITGSRKVHCPRAKFHHKGVRTMLWLLATVPAEATVSSSFVPVTNGFNYQHHQTVLFSGVNAPDQRPLVKRHPSFGSAALSSPLS